MSNPDSASASISNAQPTSTPSPTSSINTKLSSSFANANRGALTTIFTPPSSCLQTTTLVSYLTTSSGVSGSFSTTKIFINHYSWGDSSCYPSTILTVDGDKTQWANGYYYSPGICPSGWISACSITTSAFGFATTLASSQSAVMCCPSFYSCATTPNSITGHACFTQLAANQTLTSIWPAPDPTPSTPMDLDVDKTITDWVVPSATTLQCDGVPVMWQSTDVQILELLGVTTVSSSSSIASSTAGTIPSNTGPGLPTDTAKSTGLSTGAKAGIGIAIPVVLIAIVAGVFFWFRRRAGRVREEAKYELGNTEVGGKMGNMGWRDAMGNIGWKSGTGNTGWKGEMWVKPPELDGSGQRFEAGGEGISEMGGGLRRPVYELEGTGRT